MREIEALEKPLRSRLHDEDPTAITELYDAYAMALYAEIFRVVQVQRVAEDILIEVFADLWTQRSTLNTNRETIFWTLLVQARRLCQIHLAPHEDPDVSVLDWADDHESADEITRRLLDVEFDIPDNIRERLAEVINLTLPTSAPHPESVAHDRSLLNSRGIKGMIVGLVIGLLPSVWFYIGQTQVHREIDAARSELHEKDSVLTLENVDHRLRYEQLLLATDNILGPDAVKIELTGTATSNGVPILAFWNQSDSGVYIDTRRLLLENAYQQFNLWSDTKDSTRLVGRIVVSGSRVPIIRVGKVASPRRLYITLGSAYDKRDEPSTNIVASGNVRP